MAAQISSAGDSAPPYAVAASPGFAAWLYEQNVALAVTTYQIGKLFLIGAPAPDEEVPWIDDAYRPAIAAMRAAPADAVELMVANLTAPGGGDDAAGDATALLTAGRADDALLVGDVALRDRIAAMLAAAMAQGPVGVATDIVSYTVADWGFDPASIGAPTTCLYGADDLLVPPAHGEWWAVRIPAAELHVVDGAGHLVVVPAWPRVVAAARPA